MALPSNSRITELDFLQIKQNLITYLQGQQQFKDYNFSGSSINILLDILALNTAYQAFYLNMVGSEMFLDSAQLRNSVVSRAKQLGYTTRSVQSARATVNVTIDPTQGPLTSTPSTILIPTSQEFSTVVDSKTYFFTPVQSVLITPTLGVYSAQNIELIEGQRLSFSWTVDNTLPIKQRFIIPNANIDTSVLVVKVQESVTNSSIEIFTLNDDINVASPTSKVYFLQEANDGEYEIYFGDGNIGVSPQNGNIVIAEYVVSSGDAVLGATSFAAVNKLAGYNSYTINTVVAAENYFDQESIDSIKLLAPLNYEAQNRAVTKSDYETLIKKDIPSIQYVRVWGGEDNVPPEYGKVFVALKPSTGLSLSEDQKADIINTYIKPRNIISIEVDIVEPDYLFIEVDAIVNFNSKITTLDSSDISNLVTSAIESFATSTLNGFDSNFRYSKLIQAIDNADESIVGNLTDIKIKYRIFPPFNVPKNFTIITNNAFSTGDSLNNISSINSSGFYYKGILTYISDDGRGNLYLYRIVNNQKILIESNVGTVNYVAGSIQLNGLIVQNIPNSLDYIDFIITPSKDDIISLREQILLLDSSDISVTVNDVNIS